MILDDQLQNEQETISQRTLLRNLLAATRAAEITAFNDRSKDRQTPQNRVAPRSQPVIVNGRLRLW